MTTTHWRINSGFRCALSPAGNSDGGELDEVRRKGRYQWGPSLSSVGPATEGAELARVDWIHRMDMLPPEILAARSAGEVRNRRNYPPDFGAPPRL